MKAESNIEVIIDTKLHGSIKHWLYSKDFLTAFESASPLPLSEYETHWMFHTLDNASRPFWHSSFLLVFLSHIDPFTISFSRTNQNIWLIFLVIRNTTLWKCHQPLLGPSESVPKSLWYMRRHEKTTVHTNQKIPILSPHIQNINFFFLAMKHGMWDPNSLTRHQTHVPYIGGVESQPLDRQENPPNTKFFTPFCTQVMLNSFNFELFSTPHYLAPMIEMEMNVLGPKH